MNDPKTTTAGTTGTTSGTTGTPGTTGDRSLPDELLDSARRVWLAGLGALATAGEEGARAFSRLVESGREVADRSGSTVGSTVGSSYERAKDTARSTWNDLGSAMDETLTATLHRLGVPTRDDIQTLTRRVEELSAKIEQLRGRPATAAGPTSTAPSGHTVVDAAGNPVPGPGADSPIVDPTGRTTGT